MTELRVGNIQFGTGRLEHAFSIIQDEWVDGQAWKEAFYKAEYELDKAVDEIAELKKQIKKLRAKKK